MSIKIVRGPNGVVEICTSVDTLYDGQAVKIGANKQVSLADDTDGDALLAQLGFIRGNAVSGEVARVVIGGMVSNAWVEGTLEPGNLVQATSGISGAGMVTIWTSGVGSILGTAIISGAAGSNVPVMVWRG
jgi:hypothetical protein